MRLPRSLTMVGVALLTLLGPASAVVSQTPRTAPSDYFSTGRGVDPECGGTHRSYYNQVYGTEAVVIPVEEMHEHARNREIIRCGYCGPDKAICWLRDGVERGPLIAQEPPEPGPPMLKGNIGSDVPRDDGWERQPDYPAPKMVQPDPRYQPQPQQPRRGQPTRGAPAPTPPQQSAAQQEHFDNYPFRLAATEQGPVGVAMLARTQTCRYIGKRLFDRGVLYVCLGGHREGDRVGGFISAVDGHEQPYREVRGTFRNGYYYVDYLDGPLHGMPKGIRLNPVR